MSELRRDNFGPVHSQLASACWEWRLEAGLGMVVMAAYEVIDRLGGSTVAQVVFIVGGIALFRYRQRFDWLVRLLHVSSVRRSWSRAMTICGLVGPFGSRPVAVEIVPAPYGDKLLVKMPPGSHTGELEEAADHLASALGVREVRVVRDRENATFAHVVVARRDSLADGSFPWPYAENARSSLWDPIPIGMDENGDPARLELPERNVLVGGEPGAGKSVFLSLLVAAAALDPTVQITLLDGKLVELAAWRGCATNAVGPSITDAIEVLGELRSEMDERYQRLLTLKRRKVDPADGLALHVVVIDELAFYLGGSDRKQRSEVTELLRDLVSRGRAAGIIVLAATQKPSADVIPTQIRDLFGFRVALRCSTPQASDTVLGQGWASLGYSAATVDPSARGVGYVLAEGGVPIRFRSCHLTDADIEIVAARAEQLRAEHGETRQEQREQEQTGQEQSEPGEGLTS
jgi:hypothetical protein